MPGVSEKAQSAGVKAAARGAKIRDASFGDYAQIAALELRYGIRPKTEQEWVHLWRGNPAYRELKNDWRIGWVVEDERKQIVASVGNIPLLYEFEGKRVIAASGRAQVAEPAYRSASLPLLGQLIHQRGVDLYLNNTMSREAAPSFNAFECPRVPAGAWDASAFWITNCRGFSESLLRGHGYPPARALSYPISAAAFLTERFKRSALRESDVEIMERPCFDAAFDEFWEPLKRAHPHTLLALRTREALEWHFKHALEANRVWIVTAGRDRLDAYAVFLRRDNPKSGLKRVRLVDYQAAEGGVSLLPPLLSWGLKRCREEGIHVLENIGRWLGKGDLMDSIAPHRRRLSTWTYYYRAGDATLAERLKDPQVWALASSFDGDASL